MLERIIKLSLSNKIIVLLFSGTVILFGFFSLMQLPIGAVPDITNNQVQVITTSRNLSTQDVEQYITYPVELEMANLPGVKEIRSVSKFGLSVVTIVFEDNMGTYLPRQLIAEKIKSASEKIPEGFGTPEMGPISTGLGEIYQYILDTKPGYDTVYTPMDLRTIQDWLVKRQLSGIKGVVEINTWGGYLKQYEVSINPDRLRASNITVLEVYDAVMNNNSVVGGGYIEKTNKSFFVRGEGTVKHAEDIENIIVKNINGFPVYIKDIASVKFGSATRFGAITGNGEGEKVLGQIMMLKNANSKEVIESVKKRVEEVQKILPEGVYINPFLERSELLSRTTATITENLVLGCLIVIFVVVLLLGNFRSGLVVASVVPLSLMFALSMMYIFGIDANLMSLGAIDFGIIIDGAVIIVEFIAFQITKDQNKIKAMNKASRQRQIDKITYDSTSKMMNSAVFGQLIILIVFIPILTLSNVEGKMFRPMALTFSFALIGAMIFCFTYVPVVSSLFLKPGNKEKRNFSDKLMALITRSYSPSIIWALGHQKIVIGSSVAVLVFALIIFLRMGGEFVPTLDEGDFVIQPVLKTGTSLSKTIETTTKIENILLDNFPEVDQVVSRIGAAEVPTDPMSMEESDVIIKLKPSKYWVSAKTKDELAEKFKEALSVLPGLDFEFTQPIEMRFNELITGVRADVAIKIFGEDLDLLYKKGLEVKKLISGVEGASDIIVEKIAGLPQMIVKYNRNKIARYGLNIEDVNQLISMQFAGYSAGIVFEGEKRFDLVVRLDEKYRKDLTNLQNMSVTLPNGSRIPLTELADVEYSAGPAKISRDETKRRIVVGVNVRNRDLQSVVEDIQQIIGSELKLPAGYTVTYGGQFENLKNAKKRLMLAVPIALFLIFVMLHIAFKSFTEALMVYTAIPLSAVGGILLLWIRNMPFSISAGVGFIALFGIAVLNGIVLVEYLKELKHEGVKDIRERILRGTHQRLRPVLLTASAAALGFLPMAISTSAGAEVQRPLATVVIGGLITSTLLTMIVLPVFYSIKETRNIEFRLIKAPGKTISIIILLLGLPSFLMSQTQELSLENAINIALENNQNLNIYRLQAEQSRKAIHTAFEPDKTEIYYNYDQNNIAENNVPLKVFGVAQQMEFPTNYSIQKKVYQSKYQMNLDILEIEKQKLIKEVSQSYYSVLYMQQRKKMYAYLDSLLSGVNYAATRKFELGESNYLQSLTAQAEYKKTHIELQKANEALASAMTGLTKLLQVDTIYTIPERPAEKLVLTDSIQSTHPGLQYYDNASVYSAQMLKREKTRFIPDIQLEYFRGTNQGENARIYHGYQFGIAVPLWFGAQSNRVKAAKIDQSIIASEALNYTVNLAAQRKQLTSQLNSYLAVIEYYEMYSKKLVEELKRTANKSFTEGAIDYYQFIQSIQSAINIELDYIDNLNNYNQTLLELIYLTI